ncbi:MAG TPA: hypothetical protein VLC52_17240 [Anaerolineae bacterium]|nr:hypothetical protein [Anaerolineae bacterium]
MQGAMPGATSPLVRVQTVRGEPYEVRGRRLVPLARVVTLGRARATIGTHRLEGRGWGLAYVKPLAVIEETPGGERLGRVAVRDGTARALVGMYVAALGITLLFAAVRWLAGRRGPAGQA